LAALPGGDHPLDQRQRLLPAKGFLAIRYDRQYFIGPDNGIFSLVFGKMPTETFVLDGYTREDALSAIYARAVAHIARDKPFQEIGLPATRFSERLAFQPVIGPNYIRGAVVFIDRFDNVTTNITRDRFEEIGRGRGFNLLIKRMAPIDGLSFRYHDVPEGEPLCRFNGDGLLEVAINLGRAATLLSINVEDMVQVEFV
jgi:S-adenosylmethionine hydrolase